MLWVVELTTEDGVSSHKCFRHLQDAKTLFDRVTGAIYTEEFVKTKSGTETVLTHAILSEVALPDEREAVTAVITRADTAVELHHSPIELPSVEEVLGKGWIEK